MRFQKRYIHTTLIALILLLCGVLNAQQGAAQGKNMIKNTDIIGHWRADAIIGLELEPLSKQLQTDEYTLKKITKQEVISGKGKGKGKGLIYGWQAEFRKDMTFISSYSSPDGRDYFSRVTGTYQFVDESRIRLHIRKISLKGSWRRERELDVELGVFLIAATENGYRLIKCADGETDQQRLAYSDMLRALPTIRTGSPDLKWIKLDPYKRDTDNLKILNKGLAADERYNPDNAKLVYSRNFNNNAYSAFIFRYGGESIIAFYSRGPEIFAVYDVIKAPFLYLLLEDTKEYAKHLTFLEKMKDVKLPLRRDKEGFLRCEIRTNWKSPEKRSKYEIITLHYYMEEKFDATGKHKHDVIILEYRTEFSQIIINEKIDKNHSYDTTTWHYVGNIDQEDIRESIYNKIFEYYTEKEGGGSLG